MIQALAILLLAAAPVTISWNPVTDNADNTPCTDLQGYTVYVEELLEPDGVAPDTPNQTTPRVFVLADACEVTVTTLVPHAARYRVWVDAVDLAGNHSEYSVPFDLDLRPPPDTTPPTPPTRIRVQ